MNIVPSNMSYYTRKLVQYDILLETIFTNIHAITLYYYYSHYFQNNLFSTEYFLYLNLYIHIPISENKLFIYMVLC